MLEPNNDFHRVSQGEGGRGAARRRGRQLPSALPALLLGRCSPSPARGGRYRSSPRSGRRRGCHRAPRAGSRGPAHRAPCQALSNRVPARRAAARAPLPSAARAPTGTFRRDPRARPAAAAPGDGTGTAALCAAAGVSGAAPPLQVTHTCAKSPEPAR